MKTKRGPPSLTKQQYIFFLLLRRLTPSGHHHHAPLSLQQNSANSNNTFVKSRTFPSRRGKKNRNPEKKSGERKPCHFFGREVEVEIRRTKNASLAARHRLVTRRKRGLAQARRLQRTYDRAPPPRQRLLRADVRRKKRDRSELSRGTFVSLSLTQPPLPLPLFSLSQVRAHGPPLGPLLARYGLRA